MIKLIQFLLCCLSGAVEFVDEENMSELFIVFHDRGYTVYEVVQCHVKHDVSNDFLLSNAFPELGPLDLGTICPVNDSCSWGDATVVGGLFVYVTQPNMKRVIVVDLKDRFNPVEVCTRVCSMSA